MRAMLMTSLFIVVVVLICKQVYFGEVGLNSKISQREYIISESISALTP